MINTRFWNDTYISDLNPLEKLLFIYFLTNEHTSICGVYELPLKVAAVETGIDPSMFGKMLPNFTTKIVYYDGWVGIKNFSKHQATNPSIKRGIEAELKLIPAHIKAKIDSLYTASIQSPGNSNSNINTNTNPKLNTNPKKVLPKGSTSKALAIDKRDPQITQLISRFNDLVGKMPQESYQVTAAIELVRDHGFDRSMAAVAYVATSRGKQYAPNIGSLEELRDKWVKLENFFARESDKGPGRVKVS